jgi:hypothetical protein
MTIAAFSPVLSLAVHCSVSLLTFNTSKVYAHANPQAVLHLEAEFTTRNPNVSDTWGILGRPSITLAVLDLMLV